MNSNKAHSLVFLSIILVAGAACACSPEDAQSHAGSPAQMETINWRETERGVLENHVQLTNSDRFVKAGEAYFSPDETKIIFQAVERPAAGQEPDDFYAMFVADLVKNNGRVTGINNIKRLSPPGSANTCGWFDPKQPGRVIFGSTIAPPTESTPPGFERATGRYRWMFPPEMKIVGCDLAKADGTAKTLNVLLKSDAYIAEGSISADGRYILYCTLESGDGDLYVADAKTGAIIPLVQKPGYDGGPFFSPDGERICYRSDRRGDSHLQLFVADLKFDASGAITGIEREYQLTNDGNVNWCPYWHPSGRYIIYGTSEVGHYNYEVFVVDADPGYGPGTSGSVRYGTNKRRVTNAGGADILPVFNRDGKLFMWTAQRDEDHSSQLWLADFVMNLDKSPSESSAYEREHVEGGNSGSDPHGH